MEALLTPILITLLQQIPNLGVIELNYSLVKEESTEPTTTPANRGSGR